MNWQLTSRSKKIIAASIVVCIAMLSAVTASACHRWWRSCYYKYYPAAYCAQYNTNQPLLPYTCCKLAYKVHYYKHGKKHSYWHTKWRDKWVSGSCKTVDSRATGSFGCTTQSPVYGTDHPIIANCQFGNVRGH